MLSTLSDRYKANTAVATFRVVLNDWVKRFLFLKPLSLQTRQDTSKNEELTKEPAPASAEI